MLCAAARRPPFGRVARTIFVNSHSKPNHERSSSWLTNKQTSITPETQAGWRSIVARAWSDEDFKQRLIDDPNAVLAEEGLPVPQGVNFVVIENEAQRVHLVLPAKPGGDVSVNQLSDSDYDPGF